MPCILGEEPQWHRRHWLVSSPMSHHSAKSTGFSLLELLVTLLIALVLIALLVPALRRARESAQQMQCVANQHANGQSIVFYGERRRGQFPPFTFGFAAGASGRIVVNVRRTAVREAGLHVFEEEQTTCPRDSELGTIPLEDSNGAAFDRVMSYTSNIELSMKGIRTTSIANPADRLVMLDGSMSGPGGRGRNIQGSYRDAFEFIERAMISRHDESVVGLFADWHVESLPSVERDQILAP